jgi:hypothetical protein
MRRKKKKKKRMICFTYLVSFKGGYDRQASIEEQKKAKRIYLVIRDRQYTTDTPEEWTRAWIDRINSNMPEHRYRKFHFIKKGWYIEKKKRRTKEKEKD